MFCGYRIWMAIFLQIMCYLSHPLNLLICYACVHVVRSSCSSHGHIETGRAIMHRWDSTCILALDNVFSLSQKMISKTFTMIDIVVLEALWNGMFFFFFTTCIHFGVFEVWCNCSVHLCVLNFVHSRFVVMICDCINYARASRRLSTVDALWALHVY